ncbi:MAG: hypothetical protein HQM06_01995 [Magnetococcales bacterium]|nr:hypothetical protein [Magnetococcales bacterium]
MTYIEHINSLLRARLAVAQDTVVFGQNIVAGSCLSGLTRGIRVPEGSQILQTQNSENTLTGIGLGMMLRGVSSIYFLKQLDFLLLGMDHLVNSYNIVRRLHAGSSFTLFAIVVDQGYEGPQSCLNNLDDFCSMAHIPGYVISSGWDAEVVLNRHLFAPGLKIICVSQRLFGTALPSWSEPVETDGAGEIFRYAQGEDVTIVSCNFSFPQALQTWRYWQERGLTASLFSVSGASTSDWSMILQDLQRTRKLLVLDDSKSDNRSSDRFLLAVRESALADRVLVQRRRFAPEWLKPNPDLLEVVPAELFQQLQ